MVLCFTEMHLVYNTNAVSLHEMNFTDTSISNPGLLNAGMETLDVTTGDGGFLSHASDSSSIFSTEDQSSLLSDPNVEDGGENTDIYFFESDHLALKVVRGVYGIYNTLINYLACLVRD